MKLSMLNGRRAVELLLFVGNNPLLSSFCTAFSFSSELGATKLSGGAVSVPIALVVFQRGRSTSDEVISFIMSAGSQRSMSEIRRYETCCFFFSLLGRDIKSPLKPIISTPSGPPVDAPKPALVAVVAGSAKPLDTEETEEKALAIGGVAVEDPGVPKPPVIGGLGPNPPVIGGVAISEPLPPKSNPPKPLAAGGVAGAGAAGPAAGAPPKEKPLAGAGAAGPAAGAPPKENPLAGAGAAGAAAALVVAVAAEDPTVVESEGGVPKEKEAFGVSFASAGEPKALGGCNFACASSLGEVRSPPSVVLSSAPFGASATSSLDKRSSLSSAAPGIISNVHSTRPAVCMLAGCALSLPRLEDPQSMVIADNLSNDSQSCA
jgi:hypothetical protein